MIALIFLASIYSPNCLAYAHDGETIERCDGKLIRLLGIDAPEPEGSPQCASAPSNGQEWCSTELSEAARETLDWFIKSGVATVWYAGSKNREGHFLASVSINGIDASDYLVGKGLARAVVDLPTAKDDGS